jgi:hypothetical protein
LENLQLLQRFAVGAATLLLLKSRSGSGFGAIGDPLAPYSASVMSSCLALLAEFIKLESLRLNFFDLVEFH